MSGDVGALIPHIQLSLGLRGVVPRPVMLLSRFASTEASDVVTDSRSGPIRLLFVSHNLSHEGATISLKELVCGLSKRHTVEAKVVAFEDGPLRAEYESYGIPVQVLPSFLHKISTRKRLNREIERLSLFIQSTEAEVVFVNTLLNFPAILAAEHAGLPSVWNPRESEPWDSYFGFLPDPVAQTAIAAIGLPRKVVFVAEATRAVWKDFESSGNFAVIHNSLNQERFAEYLGGDKAAERDALGWTRDEVVFLCVGTLCERKGQADVLLALERIADKLTASVRIVFAGDASSRYARYLQRLASHLCEQEKILIDFVDATGFVGRYYLAADVFLLCSRIESYPRVVLEAMAFGLPIISTPVFGVAEQLPNPADACFYEPGNPEALGAHMLQLATSVEARRSLKKRSRTRFEEMHSFDQMLSAYERILQTI
jgi:glycosyltransferase involved in cell wall biosynthesis